MPREWQNRDNCDLEELAAWLVDHGYQPADVVEATYQNYQPHVRRPFGREPDFGVTSVNYDLDELLARAKTPS